MGFGVLWVLGKMKLVRAHMQGWRAKRRGDMPMSVIGVCEEGAGEVGRAGRRTDWDEVGGSAGFGGEMSTGNGDFLNVDEIRLEVLEEVCLL